MSTENTNLLNNRLNLPWYKKLYYKFFKKSYYQKI